MTVWIGLALVSLCILAVHVMLTANRMSRAMTPDTIPYVPLVTREMPAVTREAIRWAAQRTLDRGTWMAFQQQAMRDWEAACQCPDPNGLHATYGYQPIATGIYAPCLAIWQSPHGTKELWNQCIADAQRGRIHA